MFSDAVLLGILTFLGVVVATLGSWVKGKEEGRSKEMKALQEKSNQQDERLDDISQALQDEREAHLVCEREKNAILNESLIGSRLKDNRIRDLEEAFRDSGIPLPS